MRFTTFSPLCPAAVAPQTSWTWWWMDSLSLSPPTRRQCTAAGDSASPPAQGPDPPSSYWLRRLPAVTSHLNQMAVTAPSCPAKALTTPHPLTRRSSHHTLVTGWVTGMSGSYMLPFQMTRTLDRLWLTAYWCSAVFTQQMVKAHWLLKNPTHTDWQQTPVFAALFPIGCSWPAWGHSCPVTCYFR